MKCPSCGKSVSPRAQQCKHCGVVFVRKSKKIVRQMTGNSRITFAAGLILICLGVLLAIYGSLLLGIATFAVGALLAILGKKMG